MRKNTKEVFNIWQMGGRCTKYKSISTDGTYIYSYNTPIVKRLDQHITSGPRKRGERKPQETYNAAVDGTVGYSSTTTKQQHDLCELLLNRGFGIQTVQRGEL